MKTTITILLLSLILTCQVQAQKKVYSEHSGEIIFSFADVEYLGQNVPTNMRFTLFLHLGENLHYDFTDNFGMYSGWALRNIGIITEDNDIKIKRRTYSLGIPLALKFGSFPDHFYFYGGGSYELFFHYKQKLFVDGQKIKYSEWFSDRTPRFVPALFAGVQFPGGINLKFKYYLSDFLNSNFKGNDFGEIVDYSDFTKTTLYYVSVSFNLRNDKLKELTKPDEKSARYAFYSNEN